jgi:hypothetical protein
MDSAVQCSAVSMTSAVQSTERPLQKPILTNMSIWWVFNVQCSAVQCSAVRCSAVQCSVVHCSAVRCSGYLISIQLLAISISRPPVL